MNCRICDIETGTRLFFARWRFHVENDILSCTKRRFPFNENNDLFIQWLANDFQLYRIPVLFEYRRRSTCSKRIAQLGFERFSVFRKRKRKIVVGRKKKQYKNTVMCSKDPPFFYTIIIASSQIFTLTIGWRRYIFPSLLADHLLRYLLYCIP